MVKLEYDLKSDTEFLLKRITLLFDYLYEEYSGKREINQKELRSILNSFGMHERLLYFICRNLPQDIWDDYGYKYSIYLPALKRHDKLSIISKIFESSYYDKWIKFEFIKIIDGFKFPTKKKSKQTSNVKQITNYKQLDAVNTKTELEETQDKLLISKTRLNIVRWSLLILADL